MKALVIGSTGLVGKEITNLLLNDHEVHTFSRRSSGITHPNLHEHLVDFDKIGEWKHLLKGDVLFSALGTTLKTVGSKSAQYKIDHDYQLEVATAAALNGVASYSLISSVNADSSSMFFYLRMKGELEDKVSKLSFKSINILRPGPLKGFREKERLGEVVSTKVLDLLPDVLVTPGIRPVAAFKVAKKSVNAGLAQINGVRIIGPKEILSE